MYTYKVHSIAKLVVFYKNNNNNTLLYMDTSFQKNMQYLFRLSGLSLDDTTK